MPSHTPSAREAADRRMLEQLEDLARQVGLRVRSERGDFRSGWCKVNGEEMIILNRRLSDGDRAQTLARLLGDQDLEEHYLLPELREFIEDARVRARRQTGPGEGDSPDRPVEPTREDAP